MRFDVITLFPAMFDAMQHGVIGRAIQRDLVQLVLWNPRDYTQDIHRRVDDRPYGGGPGMIMQYQPLAATIQAVKKASPTSKLIYLSPQGKVFRQATAQQTANQAQDLILLAGRYEGVDERFIEAWVDEEWSVGDYVVSGGELPAMLLIDSVTRLLPDVLGHTQSAQQDSFGTAGLLDCPHYTRPKTIQGNSVPKILLSGDHEQIQQWRLNKMHERTRQRRPDLLHTQSPLGARGE